VTIELAALMLAMVLPSPPADGTWEGTMRRGTATLPVRLRLDARGAHGWFSAPDLGAIDIPLARVHVSRAVHCELVGDRTTTFFDATVAGNAMTGTFREGALRPGTIRLHRVAGVAARPYALQQVTFANGSVRLGGTVYVPRAPGKHPAVVLVHGSGPEGRWATAYIADALARRGVVALAYDKRGVGASSGDWRTSTLEDLAADARIAVHLLAERPDVDPARVGVYGHSQGAEIAPQIARDNPEVRWIAAADGPIGPLYRQDIFRVDTALAKRYSGDALARAEALYAEMVDVARTGAPHDKLRADIAAAGGAPWLDDLAIPNDDNWIWAWYAKVGDYDNTDAWAHVTVPVLVLFGENDAVVPERESVADTLRVLHAHGNDRVTVRIFPGADHTLRIAPAGADGWPRNAPGFPDVLAAFANRPGAAAP
jgi:alpha-beta hydrolase superfamily lysophospholipase